MRLWTTVNRWDLTTRSISSTSNAYLSIRKKDKERESLSLAAFGRSGRRRYFAPKARLLIRGPHTARPEPGPFVAAAPHILHHAPKRIEETNFLKRKRDVYTRRLWTRLHTSGVGPTPDKVWNTGRWEERSGGVMTRVQAVQSTSPPSRLVRVHLKPPRDRCKQRLPPRAKAGVGQVRSHSLLHFGPCLFFTFVTCTQLQRILGPLFPNYGQIF
jgi:hypothetical protein